MGIAKEYIMKCKQAFPLRSREWYLETFGIPPEEIFTPEELRRISVLVQRDVQLHEKGDPSEIVDE